MSGKIQTPHAKKRQPHLEVHPPYPIQLKDWNLTRSTLFTRAVLKSDSVEVLEGFSDIFYYGYFGKGSHSKSAPVFKKQDDSLIEGSGDSDEFQNSELGNKINAEPNAESQKDCLEKLCLSHQEAFFLCFAVPCLVVEEYERALNLDELWSRLCELNKDFVLIYVAYHHFRSKGWIVRSGLRFGTNFLLYKDGPPFFHASYSVLVQEGCAMKISWKEITSLNRTTINSGKEVLICLVQLPEDVSSPNCLQNCTFQEVLLSRWQHGQEN